MSRSSALLTMVLLGSTAACSGARAGVSPDPDGGAPRSDVTATADVPITPVIDVPTVTPDVPVAVDIGPRDTGTSAPETYPAGPYGTSVGRLFRPFTLTACNREGDAASWRFDGPDFFTSQLTVINIATAWSVPSQRETSQIQGQIIERYAGQGVRFVQLLVQNTDGSAITPTTCRSWVTRYGVTFPELMDPTFVTQPYVPMTAFPANVIVDRCGRIRWREFGAESGLTGLRTAIDEVLADPRYPSCPSAK
ncbi:MAG: hypothetical protein Q7V43_06255 [Myxococcales bacterium]|nr:hypothetical protein [Myxococcales bacterium]